MNDPVMAAAVKALGDLWDEGCPIPSPAGRELLAATGLRRWRSLARRHRRPERLTRGERIRDLAKGLVEACEPDPRMLWGFIGGPRRVARSITAHRHGP